MVRREIIWHLRARKAYFRLIYWYLFNVGQQFVNTINDNMGKTIELVSKSPSVGKLIKKSNEKTYRSILTHKKTRIIYWYNKDSVHIVRLIMNTMDNKENQS